MCKTNEQAAEKTKSCSPFSCQKPFKFSLFYKGYMSNLYARGVAMLCRAPVADFAAPVGMNPFMLPFYTIISEFWLLIRHLICLDGKEANIEFQFLAARFTFNKPIRLLSIISVRGMIKLNQLCPQCSKAFQLFWANWPKETSDKVRQI